MKYKLLEVLLTVLVILGIMGFCRILTASKGCSDMGAMWDLTGLFLWRRLAGIGFILALVNAFGVASSLLAKARNHPLITGFLQGFTLNALGGFL